MSNLLARAEIVARLAHAGQVDKCGTDYIEHCKAVVDGVRMNSPNVMMTAWLHDTVEDTPLSLHDLRNLGFPEIVVQAVGILTEDLSGQISHDDYLRNIRDRRHEPAGNIAFIVKLADIDHNADPNRGSYLTPEKLERRRQKSLDILFGVTP